MYKYMEYGIFGSVRHFSALWDFFEKNFLAHQRSPGIINPPPDSFSAAG